MKKVIYLFCLAIFTSFNFASNSLETKINNFVLNQKRYLSYKPKTVEEKNEMGFGIGKVHVNAIYQKDVILFRKNNLPDTRKPEYYVSYTFLKYKDSTQCKEALLNWFNCFGFDCSKIELKKDMGALKTTPMYIIVNSDEILIMQTQCELTYGSDNPQNKSTLWNNAILEFKRYFSKPNSTFIEIGCGGPVKWALIH